MEILNFVSMLSRVSFSGTHLARVFQSNPARQVRSLTWKATGKRVTHEEMEKMLRSSRFMNNMTRITTVSLLIKLNMVTVFCAFHLICF